MGQHWTGLIIVGAVLNLVALAATSPAYTAWGIRVRNRMYYALLRREVNLWRAEHADEIAIKVVRWLRPLMLVIVNLFWIWLILKG